MQVAFLEQPTEFQVSVENFGEDAWLRVPRQVVSDDPRWRNLTESGIIQASWDGFNLKFSAVTQKSLALESQIKKAAATGADCCAVCQFFEQGSCCAPSSPLFEFKVDPAGVCGEFQRISEQ